MAFKRFEDIHAWQQARELCQLVEQLTNTSLFERNWTLKNQIKSASGSAMDCIAEGYERNSNNEFRYFLSIFKGSAGEVRSQAYRALDGQYITPEEFERLVDRASKLSASLYKLIQTLNETDYKGIRNIKRKNGSSSNDDPFFPSTPP